MVGIIYNTNMVDEEDIGSWDLLWNNKYTGKILQFNNARDAFGTAMYYQQLDVNTKNRADWEIALQLLKDQKPIVQGYVMDEVFNKMKGESAAIAPYYAGDYLTMYDSNDALAFYYPEEGTNIFVDAMCIPKGSRHKDVAEAYINFMLSEEIAVANAEYPHTIPLGHPSAPAPSTLYHATNLDWQFVSYMILCMFQCHRMHILMKN